MNGTEKSEPKPNRKKLKRGNNVYTMPEALWGEDDIENIHKLLIRFYLILEPKQLRCGSCCKTMIPRWTTFRSSAVPLEEDMVAFSSFLRRRVYDYMYTRRKVPRFSYLVLGGLRRLIPLCPTCAQTKIAYCSVCDLRFLKTDIDVHGMCPLCHKDENKDERHSPARRRRPRVSKESPTDTEKSLVIEEPPKRPRRRIERTQAKPPMKKASVLDWKSLVLRYPLLSILEDLARIASYSSRTLSREVFDERFVPLTARILGAKEEMFPHGTSLGFQEKFSAVTSHLEAVMTNPYRVSEVNSRGEVQLNQPIESGLNRIRSYPGFRQECLSAFDNYVVGYMLTRVVLRVAGEQKRLLDRFRREYTDLFHVHLPAVRKGRLD